MVEICMPLTPRSWPPPYRIPLHPAGWGDVRAAHAAHPLPLTPAFPHPPAPGRVGDGTAGHASHPLGPHISLRPAGQEMTDGCLLTSPHHCYLTVSSFLHPAGLELPSGRPLPQPRPNISPRPAGREIPIGGRPKRPCTRPLLGTIFLRPAGREMRARHAGDVGCACCKPSIWGLRLLQMLLGCHPWLSGSGARPPPSGPILPPASFNFTSRRPPSRR